MSIDSAGSPPRQKKKTKTVQNGGSAQAPLNTSAHSARGQLTADGLNHAIKWKIDLLCCH